MRLLVQGLALALILFSVTQAQADYLFDASACVVSQENNLRFESRSQSTRLTLRAELFFRGEDLKLPVLRVSFLGVQPAKVNLVWEGVDYSRSSREVYYSSVRNIIEQVDGLVQPLRNVSSTLGDAIYETPQLGLLESQALVALFVAQNSFTVEVEMNGEVLKARQSLSGSDSAFRKLASTCFPELSSKYLSPTGARLDVAAEGVAIEGRRLGPSSPHASTGYGLTDYIWVEEFLPQEFKYPAKHFEDGESSGVVNQRLAKVASLASEKRSNLSRLSEVTADEAYVALNQALTGQFGLLENLYSRFSQVTEKDIDAALIEQQRIADEIARLNKNIEVLLENQWASRTAKSNIEVKLEPHYPQLIYFETEMSSRHDRLAELQAAQARFEAYLSEQIEVLTALGARESSLNAPFSEDEIVKNQRENSLRRDQIGLLKNVRDEVVRIQAGMHDLLRLSEEQEALARSYLDISRRLGQTKRTIGEIETWLYEQSRVPNFSHQTLEKFKSLNLDFEGRISKSADRSYDAEFDLHAAQYEIAQEAFNKALAQLKSRGFVLAEILCRPEVLLDPSAKTAPCLFVDEVLDQKAVEAFLLSLPPQNLNRLLNEGLVPWSETTSKAETLYARVLGEASASDPAWQSAYQTWTDLRFVIWRWVSMQKEAAAFEGCKIHSADKVFKGGQYSERFYLSVFECELTLAEMKKAEIDSLRNERSRLEAELRHESLLYDQADSRFSLASADFIYAAQRSFNLLGNQIDFSKNFAECVIPLEKAEACNESLVGGEKVLSQQLQDEQKRYVEMAQGLVYSIRYRIEESLNFQRSIMAELEKFSVDLNVYESTHGIPALIKARDVLAHRLEQISQGIERARASVAHQKDRNVSSQKREVRLREEAFILSRSVSGLLEDMKLKVQMLAPFCRQIVPITEKLNQIDASYYELFGKPQTVGATLYSTCQYPQLENYRPSPEWTQYDSKFLNGPR